MTVSDDHALAMVKAGVHRDLVTPLTSDSTRLQMAALSLLRNLCLPAANKTTLLEEGMLDHLLGLSVVEQPALFKVSSRSEWHCSRSVQGQTVRGGAAGPVQSQSKVGLALFKVSPRSDCPWWSSRPRSGQSKVRPSVN